MRKMQVWAIVLSAAALWAGRAPAGEKLDYPEIVKIRDEGFRRSRVMEFAETLADLFGPRTSNSPQYDQAAAWARQVFEEIGATARLEPYALPYPSWANAYTSVHMIKPQYMTLIAYARPYSGGTDGRITGPAVAVDIGRIFDRRDLERHRGKLTGKVVLTAPARPLHPNFAPQAVRLSQAELDDMSELRILPGPKEAHPKESVAAAAPLREPLPESEIIAFFSREGVAALIEPGPAQGPAPMDKGLVVVGSGRPFAVSSGEAGQPLSAVVVSVEHYNRIMRLLERGVDVTMELETRVRCDPADSTDYNVIAEIAGTDLGDEVVMIGGHLDSVSAATGATDNAAGCAAVMEAFRILKAVGVRPRRTIRAALWGGEEMGHLGSKAYVAKHFGPAGAATRPPEYDKFSVYFNMDWYGRFRGVFLQGNDLVRPIFEEWMRPFHDVGMTALVPGNTGGTDHVEFTAVGLPGFQFIQDDLEFFTTTFHTNMDVYDRLVPQDLMQASVILAAFAYEAAMRADLLPRTPDQVENTRRWHK